MEKKNLERDIKDRRGLEDISNLFLSASEKSTESLQETEDPYTVEETVTVCKKLAFQDDENVQQNMMRTLSKHLEDGYHFKRIDLQKNEDVSNSRGRIHREEEVIIFKKAP